MPGSCKLVVALRVFLFFASDNDDVGLDCVVGVECRWAITPAALQPDIFVDGVFMLGHVQILRNLILGC